MESELRLHAEELVRKRINDCINPEAINEAITAITVDLYNLYWDSFLFGSEIRKPRIYKRNLSIQCNGTSDHNHLLCPLKESTPEG